MRSFVRIATRNVRICQYRVAVKKSRYDDSSNALCKIKDSRARVQIQLLTSI